MSESQAKHPESLPPELEVVAVRPIEVGGHTHIEKVKLANGDVVEAADMIAAIDAHKAHYVMRPPEGAPAYQAHQETGLPLLVQTRDCPDCAERVLFA